MLTFIAADKTLCNAIVKRILGETTSQDLSRLNHTYIKNRLTARTGLLNSFSSVDHHIFSDNSVDPSR